MKVENGKIVQFTQSFVTAANGFWGAFLREVEFPYGLNTDLIHAMAGKTVGDEFSLEFKAFDHLIYDDSLVFKVPVSKFNGIESLQPGMVFRSGKLFNSTHQLQGVIKSINGSVAVIDCNHPMIGQKNIITNVCIIEVRPLRGNEISGNFPQTMNIVT